MWDFSVVGAMRLMGDTLPFVGLRVVVYFGIAAGYLLVTTVGRTIGYGIGALVGAGGWGSMALWGGVIGFGVFGVLMYRLRKYVLYKVKAGHVAIVVERMDGKPLPAGTAQIHHAAALVRDRFGKTSALFVVDQVIKGVVAAIYAMMRSMPIARSAPGMRQMVGVVQLLVRVAVGFVDELIVARIMRAGTTNPWQSARDALVLYGQNYPLMWKNAAWLALLIYLLSLLVFLVLLAPAAEVAQLIPGAWAGGGYVVALLFTWSVKAALIDPLAIICLMQVYFEVIEGQRPDPEWGARLEQMSDKFRQLKARALGAAGNRGKSVQPA